MDRKREIECTETEAVQNKIRKEGNNRENKYVRYRTKRILQRMKGKIEIIIGIIERIIGK